MANNKTLFTLSALSTVLLLSVPCPAFATDVTGTWVQTIVTKSPESPSFEFKPSPDPSDIAILVHPTDPATYTLLVCDGEVDEIPDLFTGDNLFEIGLAGSDLGTLLPTSWTTTNLSRTGYSNEPAGCLFVKADATHNSRLFISDDDQHKVFVTDLGPDEVHGTADDLPPISLSTAAFGSYDPEGVAYAPPDATGQETLYIADGVGAEIYKVQPGADNRFDTPLDNVVTHFDTESLGVWDPEGVEFEPPNRLYIIGTTPINKMAHIYTAGTLIRMVDLSAVNVKKPAGLALGPSSSASIIDPAALSVYIPDRGIDNDSDPAENDGKIYEFTVPALPPGNHPSVSAGPDQNIFLPHPAGLNGIAVYDGLPNDPSGLVWNLVSGPPGQNVDISAASLIGDTQVTGTATFNAPGTYVLNLKMMSENTVLADDDVTIKVFDPITTTDATIYISTTSSGSVTNGASCAVASLSFQDEDIVAYDSKSECWSMYFDGSDVGLNISGVDIDGFAFADNDDSIFLSFTSAVTLPVKDPGTGITADTVIEAFDIVRFIPTALGANTQGGYEMYFDGSDVGLNVADENIDAIDFSADGKLIISTTGSFSVPGLSAAVSGHDEDLIILNSSGFGSETGGTWEIYFDGSDVGLYDGGNAEDINGAMVDRDSGYIYLSTLGNFFVPGVSGDGADIFFCLPSSIGSKTTCTTYAPFFDGSIHGLDTANEVIDDFVLRVNNSVVDTSSPTVNITAPTADATVSGATTIVSANASDDFGVVGVQFKLDGVNLGEEITSAPYSITWDTTTAQDGSHTLAAVARDAAGHTSTSNNIPVYVANSAAVSILTFTPTADATIRTGFPSTNYGTDDKLWTDSDELMDFLMKFTVSGIGGNRTVLSAKLRLYNINNSALGGNFYRVENGASWFESTVTWNNAPAATTQFASLGSVPTKNTWYEVDMTPLITGDGEFSLRVTSTSSDGVGYNSKEVAAGLGFPPQLVVTVQ